MDNVQLSKFEILQLSSMVNDEIALIENEGDNEDHILKSLQSKLNPIAEEFIKRINYHANRWVILN